MSLTSLRHKCLNMLMLRVTSCIRFKCCIFLCPFHFSVFHKWSVFSSPKPIASATSSVSHIFMMFLRISSSFLIFHPTSSCWEPIQKSVHCWVYAHTDKRGVQHSPLRMSYLNTCNRKIHEKHLNEKHHLKQNSGISSYEMESTDLMPLQRTFWSILGRKTHTETDIFWSNTWSHRK